MDTNKVATGIKVFGAVFSVVGVGLILWMLFHTPVKSNVPEQDMPTPTETN